LDCCDREKRRKETAAIPTLTGVIPASRRSGVAESREGEGKKKEEDMLPLGSSPGEGKKKAGQLQSGLKEETTGSYGKKKKEEISFMPKRGRGERKRRAGA